mmetsp:Transcript_18013/g.29168  ORF Transcript_18013/g.29168 Transcript_18013/m.29168 type:complete len:344 (+) Transcript_18013:668-1699(+)
MLTSFIINFHRNYKRINVPSCSPPPGSATIRIRSIIRRMSPRHIAGIGTGTLELHLVQQRLLLRQEIVGPRGSPTARDAMHFHVYQTLTWAAGTGRLQDDLGTGDRGSLWYGDHRELDQASENFATVYDPDSKGTFVLGETSFVLEDTCVLGRSAGEDLHSCRGDRARWFWRRCGCSWCPRRFSRKQNAWPARRTRHLLRPTLRRVRNQQLRRPVILVPALLVKQNPHPNHIRILVCVPFHQHPIVLHGTVDPTLYEPPEGVCHRKEQRRGAVAPSFRLDGGEDYLVIHISSRGSPFRVRVDGVLPRHVSVGRGGAREGFYPGVSFPIWDGVGRPGPWSGHLV